MSDLYSILLFIFVCFLILIFFIKKMISSSLEKNKPSEDLIEWLKSVSTLMESSTQRVDTKLSQSMSDFNTRLDKAAQIISQVQKNIGEFSEIGRGMKEIQDFLQSPKLRGNIGEQVLNDLLKQFLPPQSYTLQYVFKSGEKVDAVIKTANGLIAIDAKFPMENFKKMMEIDNKEEKNRYKKEFIRDVKKHIGNIAKKYILTTENTQDYALMYIPSETVYYEIIHNQELYDYASNQRVLIVSPMSFYAYLKAILMSFEGQKIEARAKEIVSLLQSLKKDYEKTDEAISILNRHITNAYNQLPNVSRSFISFGQKLNSSQLLQTNERKSIE